MTEFTAEEIKKMRNCAVFLGEPGDQVFTEALDHIERQTAEIAQMKRGLEKAQMLECQNCHEWFFINEMFSVDACTEEHQQL